MGKHVLVFVVLFYASRAIEEIVIAPYFSVYIFGVCILMSAIYFVLLVNDEKKELVRLTSNSKPTAVTGRGICKIVLLRKKKL